MSSVPVNPHEEVRKRPRSFSASGIYIKVRKALRGADVQAQFEIWLRDLEQDMNAIFRDTDLKQFDLQNMIFFPCFNALVMLFLFT
ncbi:MAG: hypothetical protein ACFFBD_24585 [Candidatus Hodarchaeota archaeon]